MIRRKERKIAILETFSKLTILSLIMVKVRHWTLPERTRISPTKSCDIIMLTTREQSWLLRAHLQRSHSDADWLSRAHLQRSHPDADWLLRAHLQTLTGC